MDLKFTYVYLPVADLAAARTFYRDQLGLEEAWREGDTTCAFKLPGSDIQLMLDQLPQGDTSTAGMIFHVDSAEQFYHEQQGNIPFAGKPHMVGEYGTLVNATDGSGNGLYFADFS